MQGKSEVHLSGYFEPGSHPEEGMFPGMEDMEMDEEGEDESDEQPEGITGF